MEPFLAFITANHVAIVSLAADTVQLNRLLGVSWVSPLGSNWLSALCPVGLVLRRLICKVSCSADDHLCPWCNWSFSDSLWFLNNNACRNRSSHFLCLLRCSQATISCQSIFALRGSTRTVADDFDVIDEVFLKVWNRDYKWSNVLNLLLMLRLSLPPTPSVSSCLSTDSKWVNPSNLTWFCACANS